MKKCFILSSGILLISFILGCITIDKNENFATLCCIISVFSLQTLITLPFICLTNKISKMKARIAVLVLLGLILWPALIYALYLAIKFQNNNQAKTHSDNNTVTTNIKSETKPDQKVKPTTSDKLEPGTLLLHKTIQSKSSNNEYEVFIFNNCVACTCPAGGKKQLCKHLIAAIHENLELINQQAPEFCKQLVNLIELKQNKDIPQAKKLEEYAKVIYSNKEITAASYQNTIGIEESDIEELEELAEILHNHRWLTVHFYDFIRQAQKENYSVFIAMKNQALNELEKAGYISWQNLSEDDYVSHNIIKERDLYCAFSATEKLYTNKKIAGYAKGIKNLKKTIQPKDIGIQFVKADYSITLK